jgi:hypothetical protein
MQVKKGTHLNHIEFDNVLSRTAKLQSRIPKSVAFSVHVISARGAALDGDSLTTDPHVAISGSGQAKP